jgi:preprotein translocase subunit YajC
MKAHQQAISAVKRGDVVVLPSGVIGKVVRVEDAEVGVEIATGVTVKVRKAMIAEVEARGAPAPANDSKT